MNYQQFVDTWNNKGCDFDGYYGFQCYDLAHQYAVDVVGHDIPSAPAAKDLWDYDIAGYDKISNTPDAVPVKGDILVWGTGVGQWGHVAVFDHGDINSFTSFDQNWPTGSLCHLQNHNYNGLLGWFHPHSAVIAQEIPQELIITDQTRIPQIENMEVQAISSERLDNLSKISSLQNELSACLNRPPQVISNPVVTVIEPTFKKAIARTLYSLAKSFEG